MRRFRSLLSASFLSVVGLLSPAAFCDDGRIPIYQQGTITASGTYLLTRNLSVTSGIAIDIQAAHVTLDLGGWKIESTDASTSNPIIRVGQGVEDVRIRNGSLRGAYNAVLTSDLAFVSVTLENLEISDTADTALSLAGLRHIEMTSCALRNIGWTGIVTAGPNSDYSGRIVGNTFDNNYRVAILAVGGRGLVIRDNTISRMAVDGISVESSAVIEGNVLTAVPSNTGIGIQIDFFGNQVLKNVIRGFGRGVLLIKEGNYAAENVITGGGDGILTTGTRCLLERNQIEGNSGCALRFAVGLGGGELGSDNAYRKNMLRGNALGTVCDTTTGNTDAGGNIP